MVCNLQDLPEPAGRIRIRRFRTIRVIASGKTPTGGASSGTQLDSTHEYTCTDLQVRPDVGKVAGQL